MSPLSAGAVGASIHQPWTPKDLGSTLKIWLDASDSTTITESSNAVSNWADKSGNGNDLAQATGADQPTYTTNSLNGLAVVKFQLDRMTRSDIFGGSTSDMHCLFIARTNSNPTQDTGEISFNGTDYTNSNRFTFSIPSRSIGDWYIDLGGVTTNRVGSTTTADRVTTLSTLIVHGYKDSTSGKCGAWFNGGTTKLSSGNTSATTSGGIVLGGVGNRAVNWDLAEFVLCNAKLADADKDRVEGYFAWKWGVTSNLPSGHAYKNSAP